MFCMYTNDWNLFDTKDRKRPLTRSSRHNRPHRDVESDLQKLLSTYKTLNFSNDLRKYVFCVPKKLTSTLICISEALLINDVFPQRIGLSIRDLVTFRPISTVGSGTDAVNTTTTPRQFLKIQFWNKGIDMLNLPQLVHSKRVTRTIPNCVLNDRPPVISY